MERFENPHAFWELTNNDFIEQIDKMRAKFNNSKEIKHFPTNYNDFEKKSDSTPKKIDIEITPIPNLPLKTDFDLKSDINKQKEPASPVKKIPAKIEQIFRTSKYLSPQSLYSFQEIQL